MQSAEFELKKFLSAQKLKYTAERGEVFREIVRSEGRFDADELLQKLQKDHKRVSRATVYRALDLFVKLGVLRRVCMRDNTSLFESILDWKPNGYLVCMRCGQTQEFEVAGTLDGHLRKVASERGFRPQNHSIELFGYCNECQRASDDRYIL